MLEGLEICEVNFSSVNENKDERTDSDFWTKQPKKNPKLNYDKIGNCLVQSQYGISISMNEENQGYPIYRMNEIHNMLCDLEVDKCADISHKEMQVFELKDRDVLFNRTNSYEWVGRTGLYKKTDGRSFVFASYLVRFRPDENILLPEYLTTFLNTKYGVWDVKRRARQSINQTNVNPEEVKQIDIPLLSLIFQNHIRNSFDSAFDSIQNASNLYAQAETLLLETLGMADFTPSSEAVNIKSFKDSFAVSGRLDAEYYQPKYEQVICQIKQLPWQSLDYLIDNYSTGYPYKSEDYVESSELPLIRINNIKKGFLDISNAAFLPEAQKHLSEKDIANEGDLLISMSGTIGSACVVPVGITAVVNQRIMRLTIKNYNPLVLMLIINSIVGASQLERIGTGGVQTNISSGDISQMIVPVLDMDTQQKIADLVQQSFALKAQSAHLLDVAKRAVEMAIEQDEAVALAYIASEVNNGDQ